jgi:hypothetical protein
MRDLVILLVHVITIILCLVPPGGVRAVVAESVLAKHQLLILNRIASACAKSPCLGSAHLWYLFALD